MEKIKIIIVDDEKLIRDGLNIILSTYEDIEVIGLLSNGKEAYEFCRDNSVDVVLMDIRMPKYDGVLGTKLIIESCKSTKVLILTTFEDNEYIKQALNYGASGYLLKNSSYDLIYGAINAVHKGNVVVHPNILSKLINEFDENESTSIEKLKYDTSLTEREISVIEEIAKGLTNKEISEKLYLTEGTIKNIITLILSKLSLRDRTQIAIYAFKNNIVN